MDRLIFGWELVMDLRHCNLKIRSVDMLKAYLDEMCKVLDMKKFGEPIVGYFGEKSEITKGYTIVQLIETSSITGHFSDYYKTAHINIHSCKEYDAEKAYRFSVEYFGADDSCSDKVILTRYLN